MMEFLQCCLLMTCDYNNIAGDLVIFFNGGALKTLDERTQSRQATVLSVPDCDSLCCSTAPTSRNNTAEM